MILEIILSGLAGLILGVLTGLTPGIHNNTVNTILIVLIPTLSIKPLVAIIFVVVLAITHTIIDFIPSVFASATDGDSALGVLPGHEMLKNGEGIQAVVCSVIGSIITIPIILLIIIPFIITIPIIINQVKTAIPFILIFVSLYSIIREKYIWTGFSVWMFAGFLGYAALNLPITEPLLPLLSGLFGGSGLVLSILQKTKIPKQKKFRKIKFEKGEIKKAVFGAVISAPLCSFLPAIGSGQAATIGSEIFTQTRRGFLIMLGAINSIVMTLSFATLYSINKTRTGAAAAIKSIIGSPKTEDIIIILIAAIISIAIASIISIKLSKIIANSINKINYQILSGLMLSILLIFIFIFTNLLGLIVFITGTALGIFTIQSGIRRINLMGCLMLPTILFYLF